MISLIDSNQQYILAEATKTLSLVSDKRHKPGDEVWLGNAILKKNDAVCYHTFGQKYTATDEDGHTYTTEGMVVPDMRLDSRFKDRSYVTDAPGVYFYAGVPIKTKSGHRIGVYAVSDSKPRHGLDVDELIFMEDVAAAVMEHLELSRDRDAKMSGEKMVRGLANFIEGTEDDEDLPLGSSGSGDVDSATEGPMGSPRMSAVMKKQSENARKVQEDVEEMATLLEGNNNTGSNSNAKASPSKSSKSRANRDDPSRILSRAAKIIRQSTEADGVVFFNTSSRNFQGLTRRSAQDSHTDLSSGINSGSEKSANIRLRRGDSTDSGEELRSQLSGETPRPAACEVIGLSIIQAEQYGRLQAGDFSFPEDNMERYIKNFPFGKFFSFTDTGSGVSSGDEFSSEDKASENEGAPERKQQTMRPETPARNKKERFVPTELLKVLPGIRSLIFLPLWDFTEGRYIAGGFIWTSTAGRLMNPENELPYLKAFGNSIMSEISRVKATKSDVAKTTFIASISHELRSPLHGILGSVEFLHETAVSAYQAGLFTSIETCGKTLLDTIDHVLDYAKINKLRKGSSARRRGIYKQGQRKDQLGSIVGLTAEFNLASLVEEVVDAVTAGHVFRRNHPTTVNDPTAISTAMVTSKAAESKPTLLDPVVILDVKPHSNWFVRTQPGALRRIVMNLLGNALKYTDFGFVTVSLQVESETEHHIKVRMRFVDSGRGMSIEFQRTRLFSAFSQEDPFATGTGLGLSIVRQLVEGLDGVIAVSSTQHVGTEVDVVLTLPTVNQADAKQIPGPLGNYNKDTTVCIVDPVEVASHAGMELQDADARGLRQLMEALRSSCKEWFGVNVVAESKENHGPQKSFNSQTPNYVLFPLAPPSAEALSDYYHKVLGPNATAPMIILCSNTGQASDFRSNFAEKLLESGIQSIPVTQPLGPKKLANIIAKVTEDEARKRQRIVLGRKESDPESLRRERDIIRKAQMAQRREVPPGGKRGSPPNASDSMLASLPVRPGPSALIHVESATDPVDDLPEASPTQNLTLARISEQTNSQRSMSAPPLRLGLPASQPPSPTPARLNVLLVDDNNINLQLLVMFMKKQKMPYATATNGLEALETYRAGCPSTHWAYPPFHKKSNPSPPTSENEEPGPNKSTSTVATSRSADSLVPPAPSSMRQLSNTKRPPPFTHILMDLSMPVMDGVTSTRKIRAFEAEAGIEPPSTIIALTGLASAEAQNDALGAGINKFLIKPVKFGELKGLLKDQADG